MMRAYRNLVFIAAALAFLVVVVGAYVRLQNAGLGCPDWPGCYGQLIGVPDAAHEVASAEQNFPGKPVIAQRAWKEMFHRYLAGTLVLLTVSILVMTIKQKRPALLPASLIGVIVLQALLGMWTVTLLLKPVVVTLHLIGGMTTLALLSWLAARQANLSYATSTAVKLHKWALLGLVILACQIMLGGWVSTNYAALVCPDFPTCNGSTMPQFDFVHGFQLIRELGADAAGAPLSLQALQAIHWAHRGGALLTFVYLAALALALLRVRGARIFGAALLTLLMLQVGLGISNVVLRLPLVIAVGHNAGAAALLVLLVVINFALYPARKPAL